MLVIIEFGHNLPEEGKQWEQRYKTLEAAKLACQENTNKYAERNKEQPEKLVWCSDQTPDEILSGFGSIEDQYAIVGKES